MWYQDLTCIECSLVLNAKLDGKIRGLEDFCLHLLALHLVYSTKSLPLGLTEPQQKFDEILNHFMNRLNPIHIILKVKAISSTTVGKKTRNGK